jgi:FKBP-type peptidyl-prolyl cis-trans isomerase FklB
MTEAVAGTRVPTRWRDVPVTDTAAPHSRHRVVIEMSRRTATVARANPSTIESKGVSMLPLVPHIRKFGAVLLLFVAGSTCFAAEDGTAQPASPTASSMSQEQRWGYAMGVRFGRQFRTEKLRLDVDALLQGMRDAFTGQPLKLTDPDMQAAMESLRTDFEQQAQQDWEEQGKRNKVAAVDFLAKNASAEGVLKTASGLQYRIVKSGDGPKPRADDNVRVSYRGRLIDGTEFENSNKMDKPPVYLVKQLIPGWIEALQMMPVGSSWRFYLPPELGYGEKGSNKVGPNAVLIFDVELLDIVSQQELDAASAEEAE